MYDNQDLSYNIRNKQQNIEYIKTIAQQARQCAMPACNTTATSASSKSKSA